MATPGASKKKCRQYFVEYLKYGFIQSPINPQQAMCLVCDKNLSNETRKPSRLLEHLQKIHPDKSGKTLAFFHSLRDHFLKRKTMNMFTSSSKNSDDGLKASYNISLLIAKAGKPHTIGEELILPAVKEVIKTVLHKSPEQVIKLIRLSDNSVQRRVDKMAENVEETLSKMLMTTEFSLKLDESILPGNESLLLAYVRFIKGGSLCQELLFARLLETDTKGESVYRAVEDYFQKKSIPLTNIILCAPDGAPSLVGHHRGFLSYLKKAVPKVLTVHCVIHRQHLMAKNLSEKLHESLSTVITAVNKIKANVLNSQLFHQLCIENDEDFQCLLLHTEVRWLSKGNSLKRFYTLFNSVLDVFQESNPELYDQLISSKTDIAYLTEMFSKFNEVNLQLQGDETSLIKAKSALSAFFSKLQLYCRNLGRREFRQFPCLSDLEKKMGVKDDDITVYCAHLAELHRDMSIRFNDLFSLEIPGWVIDPFTEPSTEVPTHLEEELVNLQNDEDLKPKFKTSYQAFWIQTAIPKCYPTLWKDIKLFFIAFLTSYLVDRGFSTVSRLLTKQRNKLNITERGDLRLLLTNLHPDVDSLICNAPSPPISLSRVVVNDYSFSFTIYFMFSSRCL